MKTKLVAEFVLVFLLGLFIGMFAMGKLWIGYAANDSLWVVQHSSEE